VLLSVDNDGNVYVVGSNNVVVISPDGQRHRQLLSSKDGLKKPRVLEYDISTNRLLVVNNNTTAFLFDVTRGQ
jgi:sugar lactone lactonase YvrE